MVEFLNSKLVVRGGCWRLMFSTYITFHERLLRCFVAPSSFSYHPRVVGSRNYNDFVDEKKGGGKDVE